MSNTYYYACAGCWFLVGTDSDEEMKCPHCIKNFGIISVGDAREYRDQDDDGYNNGFPEYEKHKCPRCDNGKLDLNGNDEPINDGDDKN